MGVPLSNLSVAVSSGQDLPSGEFVSTVPISTDNVLPTAGPGTAATQKSGAIFTEVPVEPLPLPNPLPLLPPEQLPGIAFTPEEPPVIPGEPIIQPTPPINGFPSLGSNAWAQLDDDALIGGIEGGIGDDPNAVNVTGILSHDYGSDGPGTTLLTADAHSAGRLYGLCQRTGYGPYNPSGQHKPRRAAGLLSNTTDGSYTVTQLNSVTHPAGGDENNLQFSINYVVTDGNGDRATGSFSIDVDDDTPTVSGNNLVQLDDDALAGGNPGGTGDDANAVNATGTLAHSYGADGAGTTLLSGTVRQLGSPTR